MTLPGHALPEDDDITYRRDVASTVQRERRFEKGLSRCACSDREFLVFQFADTEEDREQCCDARRLLRLPSCRVAFRHELTKPGSVIDALFYLSDIGTSFDDGVIASLHFPGRNW